MTGTPHDALFKDAFSDPERAAEELRAVLPPALVATVDWSSLALVPGSFVDDALGQRHSDLLFRVRVHGGGDALVYLLFEHQSTADPLMPWRLVVYMVRIWERLVAEGATRLPLIVPVVLHHGDAGWSAPRSFESLYDAPPEVVAAAGPHALRLSFVLDDLADLDDEDLRGRVMDATTKLVLAALRDARSLEDILDMAERWMPLIRDVGTAESGLRALVVLLRYTQLVRGGADAERLRQRIVKELGPGTEANVHSILDSIRDEGRVIGRAEGEARGRAEVVLKLVQLRFGALPETTVARIRAASADELDRLTERVLSATTLEEMLAP